MNLAEVERRIAAETAKLGIDFRHVRQKAMIQWFAERTQLEVSIILGMEPDDAKRARLAEQLRPSLVPTIVVRGRRFPFNDHMVVLGLFGDDDEPSWRVYAVPVEGPEDQKPVCYTLSRSAFVMDSDQMNIDTFVLEIANEWSRAYFGEPARTREKAAIIEYLNTLPVEHSIREAAQEIGDDLHLVSDDDDDDDDAQEGEEPAPAPEPNPTAAGPATTSPS